MFKIGDFSRIARVSARLLRYYDELGLLRPQIVDSFTGYRLYSAAQLPQLNRILVLKQLGLNLDQIGKIMEQNLSAQDLRGMLMHSQSGAGAGRCRGSGAFAPGRGTHCADRSGGPARLG